jgi:hypothetical protein
VSGLARHDGLAVVSLQRGPDGSYTAVGLRYAGYRGEPDQRTGDPSPPWNRHVVASVANRGRPLDGQGARAAVTNDPATTGTPPAMAAAKPAVPLPDPVVKSAEQHGAGTAEASRPASTPAIDPSLLPPAAADGASSPAEPSVAGAPAVASPPLAPSPTDKLISSRGRSGWGPQQAQRASVRRAGHPPSAVTLKAPPPGLTGNLLTGAVSSDATTGNPTPPKRAANPGSAAPAAPAAGASGAASGGSGNQPPPH